MAKGKKLACAAMISSEAKRDRSQEERRDKLTKVDRALKQYVVGKLDGSIVETHRVDGDLLKDYLFNALDTGGIKRFSTKWMSDALAKRGENCEPLQASSL